MILDVAGLLLKRISLKKNPQHRDLTRIDQLMVRALGPVEANSREVVAIERAPAVLPVRCKTRAA